MATEERRRSAFQNHESRTATQNPALHAAPLLVARPACRLIAEYDPQHPQQPDPRIERVLARGRCPEAVRHCIARRGDIDRLVGGPCEQAVSLFSTVRLFTFTPAPPGHRQSELDAGVGRVGLRDNAVPCSDKHRKLSLERPQRDVRARTFERRYKYMPPPGDCRPPHLISAQRPEQRARAPALAAAALALSQEIIHRRHPQPFRQMGLTASTRAGRIERPLQGHLLRPRGQIVKPVPASRPERWQRGAKIHDARAPCIRPRQADGEIETKEDTAAMGVKNTGFDECFRTADPLRGCYPVYAVAQPRRGDPALARRRTPVGMPYDFRRHSTVTATIPSLFLERSPLSQPRGPTVAPDDNIQDTPPAAARASIMPARPGLYRVDMLDPAAPRALSGDAWILREPIDGLAQCFGINTGGSIARGPDDRATL